MKKLIVALFCALAALALGIFGSYSWFSSRDETEQRTMNAGRMKVDIAPINGKNEIYIFPSGFVDKDGNKVEKSALGYKITNSSTIDVIVQANQAGVNTGADEYSFVLYKLAEDCFKSYGDATKYVDFGYLKSIGFVPYDFRSFSGSYQADRISFDSKVSGAFSANPDIGLLMEPIVASNAPYVGTSQNLYFLMAPGETVEVKYQFSLSDNSLSGNQDAFESFGNEYQYSVLALDTGSGGKKDASGQFEINDLTAGAIEIKQSAFKSVFGPDDAALVSDAFGLGWS
ncbi:MAG: hypothetical protein LBT59_06930 [Clostridiales bacterium]|nr:hypothetical protein [Clostridiales bacterium]